jgi:hypothetical protein
VRHCEPTILEQSAERCEQTRCVQVQARHRRLVFIHDFGTHEVSRKGITDLFGREMPPFCLRSLIRFRSMQAGLYVRRLSKCAETTDYSSCYFLQTRVLLPVAGELTISFPQSIRNLQLPAAATDCFFIILLPGIRPLSQCSAGRAMRGGSLSRPIGDVSVQTGRRVGDRVNARRIC